MDCADVVGLDTSAGFILVDAWAKRAEDRRGGKLVGHPYLAGKDRHGRTELCQAAGIEHEQVELAREPVRGSVKVAVNGHDMTRLTGLGGRKISGAGYRFKEGDEVEIAYEPAEEKPLMRTRRSETFCAAGTRDEVFQLVRRIKPNTRPFIALNGERWNNTESMWTSPSGEVGFPGEWFDEGDVLEIDYELAEECSIAIGSSAPSQCAVPIVGVVNELITPGDEAFTAGVPVVAGGPGIGVDGTASEFANEDVPSAVALVTGGTLSDQDRERLEEYLKNQTGQNRHKIMVLESEASKIEFHPRRAPLPAMDPTGTSAQGVEREGGGVKKFEAIGAGMAERLAETFKRTGLTAAEAAERVEEFGAALESKQARLVRADVGERLPQHGESLLVRAALSGLRVFTAVAFVSAVALVAVDWLVL